ncbi:hypothetical protein CPB85DRAFT_1253424 [Mucidula mucida]|nr:hypothetical protein CPB85DRAFT_1253424 [Mucidula mucida]
MPRRAESRVTRGFTQLVMISTADVAFVIEGRGIAQSDVKVNGVVKHILLDAVHTPSFTMNLISIPALDVRGFCGMWGSDILTVVEPQTGRTAVSGRLAMESDGLCEDCIYGKIVQHPFDKVVVPEEALGTGLKFPYFLVSKHVSVTLNAFKKFHEMAERQTGEKILHIWFDKGREFDNGSSLGTWNLKVSFGSAFQRHLHQLMELLNGGIRQSLEGTHPAQGVGTSSQMVKDLDRINGKLSRQGWRALHNIAFKNAEEEACYAKPGSLDASNAEGGGYPGKLRMWVYDLKLNGEGEIIKPKGCLVARGDLMLKGEDYGNKWPWLRVWSRFVGEPPDTGYSLTTTHTNNVLGAHSSEEEADKVLKDFAAKWDLTSVEQLNLLLGLTIERLEGGDIGLTQSSISRRSYGISISGTYIHCLSRCHQTVRSARTLIQ